jgi:hypothetical protein
VVPVGGTIGKASLVVEDAAAVVLKGRQVGAHSHNDRTVFKCLSVGRRSALVISVVIGRLRRRIEWLACDLVFTRAHLRGVWVSRAQCDSDSFWSHPRLYDHRGCASVASPSPRIAVEDLLLGELENPCR